MLNANVKKWVAALRSGEYKQGKFSLRNDDGFCCLGVACDLYAKEHNLLWNGYDFMNNSNVLPMQVMRWLGLAERNGTYIDNDRCLSDFNDKGMTFELIANIIESDPPLLFEVTNAS
jgi:hypothetical protein